MDIMCTSMEQTCLLIVSCTRVGDSNLSIIYWRIDNLPDLSRKLLISFRFHFYTPARKRIKITYGHLVGVSGDRDSGKKNVFLFLLILKSYFLVFLSYEAHNANLWGTEWGTTVRSWNLLSRLGTFFCN